MTTLPLWFFSGVFLGMIGGMFWVDQARASIFDSMDTLKGYQSEETRSLTKNADVLENSRVPASAENPKRGSTTPANLPASK